MNSICIFLLSQSSADFFEKSWSLGWLKLTFNMCFISQDKWQMSQESQEITPLALLKQSLWLTYNILGKKGEKSNKIWHYGMVGRYSCAFVFQYSIVGMLLWGFEIAALIRTNFFCVYDPFWGGWIFWGYQRGCSIWNQVESSPNRLCCIGQFCRSKFDLTTFADQKIFRGFFLTTSRMKRKIASGCNNPAYTHIPREMRMGFLQRIVVYFLATFPRLFLLFHSK